MSDDISPILDKWPYRGENSVRKIVGLDGREKVQIRVLLEGYHGVLQFECDGRPDGKRRHGREFALDYYEDLAHSAQAAEGYPVVFRLTHDQVEELFEESSITYQRYIVLLQMNDHVRVVRDTARNMRLFRFVHECAELEEDRDRLEKWWPYILRIHATSRTLLRLEKKDADGALTVLRETLRKIKDLPTQEDEVFGVEQERSIKVLEEMVESVSQQCEPTRIELLEQQKVAAIKEEDYERAAELRDQIDQLKRQETQNADQAN